MSYYYYYYYYYYNVLGNLVPPILHILEGRISYIIRNTCDKTCESMLEIGTHNTKGANPADKNEGCYNTVF